MTTKPNALKLLDAISVLLFILATAMVFWYAPLEAVMGQVQRVFYFHVATGWVGMVGFFFATAFSILVLAKGGGKGRLMAGLALASLASMILLAGVWRSAGENPAANNLRTAMYLAGILFVFFGVLWWGIRKQADVPYWDVLAVAAVELGILFSMINIITGSIWARPIWNTWWTWDPRLVTSTIMVLLYFAYLMLRQGVDNPARRARFGAVYALFGFVSVPITFLSIRIWRTIHPVVIGSGDPEAVGSFNMTTEMTQTLLFSLFVFTVVFFSLLWNRIRMGQLRDRVEQLRLNSMV